LNRKSREEKWNPKVSASAKVGRKKGGKNVPIMQKEEEAILVIHKKYGRKEPVKS
jgi:hypothetical protein